MRHLFVSLLLFPILLGCKSAEEQRRDDYRIFMSGQDPRTQFETQNENRPPPVTVIGEVRHRHIIWREGLTLANSLDASEYIGLLQPRTIYVTRDGVRYQIRVSDLLAGKDNPEILPGDIINVER